jgi:alkanesulfonate monooxygenase SsuD/methylene tetrahydromethanopterin reductase-like flavin-dependent oxidoreductase (luciferase family)
MVPGCVQQPRLPLAVAASGPATLALAARFADAWVTYGDEHVVRAQAERLTEACAAIGRDPAEISRVYLIGNTDERPLASTAAFTDFVGRYRSMGFTDFVFHHPRPDDPVWTDPPEVVDAIATEVLPTLR